MEPCIMGLGLKNLQVATSCTTGLAVINIPLKVLLEIVRVAYSSVYTFWMSYQFSHKLVNQFLQVEQAPFYL